MAMRQEGITFRLSNSGEEAGDCSSDNLGKTKPRCRVALYNLQPKFKKTDEGFFSSYHL